MVQTPLDRSPLQDEIEQSADPRLARATLTRALENQPELAHELENNALLRHALVAVAAASRSLGAALASDPASLERLRHTDELTVETNVARLHERWEASAALDDDPLPRIRRWKRQELIRIAARDLLGFADLPSVGRELAALADVCLSAAVELAHPQTPMAVIGMGKLGGEELNYSSDVDVLFVHDGDNEEADRVARAVLVTMTAPIADGIVFRTDADLRPEGRAGPLTRSLESYAAYYAQWAQTWERQALIKARFVAGDIELGERFFTLIEPQLWPERLDPDAVREVRAMKGRAEDHVKRQGLSERELKRGSGGIRDIEFAVQLLQLVHGRSDPALRSRSTLDALHALANGGYIEESDATTLDVAYRFLRTVEHRLQLFDEQQTHTLPIDVAARTRLARVLGYRDRGADSALDHFDADHRTHQAKVRSIHERLFFAPLLDTLAGVGALSLEAAEERLAAFGFLDVAQTRAALDELTTGLTRRSRVIRQLLPVILQWLSETPDPELGLLQLRRLAEGPARSQSLATTFRDSPGAAERTCRLLGSSRLVGDALRRHPDFVETLGNDAALAQPAERDGLIAEALETLEWRDDVEQRQAGLRRFKRRQLLRIAARDLLGFSTIEVTGRELAALADGCVEAALRALDPPLPFAVIGMGRLGGGELSYASDIDVLFVYDGDDAGAFDAAEHIAEQLMSEIGATTAEGQTFRIDANLRPEGKQGPLARSVDGYVSYYQRWALTWEFQALIKARPVAGDDALIQSFCARAEPFVYRAEFSEEHAREVRRMKARIERERIPPGEDPQFHLKLGRGSLSDVEFTVQLLQLQHGAVHPEIRVASTIDALHALAETGLLERPDAAILEDSYRFCERARNARYLLTGAPGDSLPADSIEAERLARLLGYVHQPQASLRDDYRRLTRRARHVVERVFYAQE